MTAIAHMPDAAAANGTTDDTAALQAMFDACPVGGLCLIPDGVFRVTNTVGPRRPMNVWCSPGAHIKGDFSGTQPVVWAFWHTPNGSSDLYVAMEGFTWQGGSISRLNRNGACLRISSMWAGSVQDVRTVRGSPHIWLDAPDTVSGWYTGGSGPNFAASARAVNCRGYDGGPLGCRIGQTPTWSGSGQSNGMMIDHCYFEGDGSAGSIGIWYMNGGPPVLVGNLVSNYAVGIQSTHQTTPGIAMGNKMVAVGQAFFCVGSTNNWSIVHPRGWQAGAGTINAAARDSQGVYL